MPGLSRDVEALIEVFDPVAVHVVALTTSRDRVRQRLRAARSASGVPLLGEATSMIEEYLTAEQERGRLGQHLNTRALAVTVGGAGHLLFADPDTPAPDHPLLRRSLVDVVDGPSRGR